MAEARSQHGGLRGLKSWIASRSRFGDAHVPLLRLGRKGGDSISYNVGRKHRTCMVKLSIDVSMRASLRPAPGPLAGGHSTELYPGLVVTDAGLLLRADSGGPRCASGLFTEPRIFSATRV
jgi:hypothetical protein